VTDDAEEIRADPNRDTTALHWEWRTFGGAFGAADATFARLEIELVEESDEVYLLSPGADAGVKVRAGRMEIKELEQVDQAGLERWWLAMSEPFPLPASEADRVCAALGVPALPPGKDAFSLDELLAALAAPERGVRTVTVHKRRLHYSVNGCRSEVAEVVAEGEMKRTLAIEAQDAARVIATVHELGLSGRDNVSYPRWLKAVVGMEGEEEDGTNGQEQESEEGEEGQARDWV
jgi:exopolyphosphatase/guanosine-5'-triphosphate,3'-diphosphate pyrophosphatase